MKLTPDIKQELIVEHKLEVGRFLYYTNVLVGEFCEGLHVTKDLIEEPILIAQQIYNEHKPVVYISHRVNSYSVDPFEYKAIIQMFPNFKGHAVVSRNKYRRMLISLEKFFTQKPVAVFEDLNSAFLWADSLLTKKLEEI